MIDWIVLLSGLALLPVVALLYFLGCGVLTVSNPDPSTPPGATPSPPPGPPPGVVPPGPPPPPPPPLTVLEVDLAADINVIKPGGTDDEVESVVVTWTLSKKTGGPVPQPLDQSIVRLDASRAFLDPLLDNSAIRVLTDDQLKLYDQLQCDCEITTRPVSGGPISTITAKAVVDLAPVTLQVFRLSPDWTTLTANPRNFTLVVVPPVTGPLSVTPTRLQLNPSKNINDIVPGGRPFKAVSIEVTWTLTKTSGAVVPVAEPLHETIVRADSGRDVLDTALDPPAMWDLSGDQIRNYDLATCQCVVTEQGTVNGVLYTETSTTNAVPVTIMKETNRVFLLLPKWDDPAAFPRAFQIVLQ